MRIGHKLILGFVGIALLIGIVGYFSVNVSQKALGKAIANSSVALVEEILDNIDSDIFHRMEQVRAFARDLAPERLLLESNQEFGAMADANAYIAKRDEDWRSAGDEESEFMRQLINNELSEEIRDEFESKEYYNRTYGVVVFSETFVTNKYGVNVAQTQRTSDYYQGDEEWWQNARRDGLYIKDVAYDESAGVYSVDICARMEDGSGDFLGVLKVVVNIEEIINIIREAHAASQYRRVHFRLLTAEGRLIYDTEPGYEIFEKAEALSLHETGADGLDYIVIKEPGKREELRVHAHSKGHGGFEGLDWYLVAGFETEEIFAPIARLKNILLAASLGIMMFAVLLGLFIAQSISGPLVRLKSATVEMGKGNLDVRADIQSKDEIGELTDSFNTMAGDLSIAIQKEQRYAREAHETMQKVAVQNRRLEASKKAMMNLVQDVEASRNDLQTQKDEVERSKLDLERSNLELETAHHRLQESQSQLIQTEKMGAIGTMVAGVAHELNNPMMVMLNLSQYCLEYTSEDDKTHAVLKRMEQEVERCAEIVDNLLTFSRIEKEGEEGFQKESCAYVLERVLKLLSYRIEEEKVCVTKHYAGETPDVYLKTNNIQQVFLNVLINALDSLKESERKEVTIDIRREMEFVQVTLTDTGCGVASENLKDMFDPFFTTKSADKGVGLGLSISRSIIESHGGEITCRSTLGEGTELRILFPIDQKELERDKDE